MCLCCHQQSYKVPVLMGREAVTFNKRLNKSFKLALDMNDTGKRFKLQFSCVLEKGKTSVKVPLNETENTNNTCTITQHAVKGTYTQKAEISVRGKRFKMGKRL